MCYVYLLVLLLLQAILILIRIQLQAVPHLVKQQKRVHQLINLACRQAKQKILLKKPNRFLEKRPNHQRLLSSEEAASESAASASKAASESAASASKAASKASSEAAEKDPNSYNTGITYDQIARSPEDYKGKKMQFTGRVIQVMEDDDETEIRLAVDGNSDNIILVGFNPDILSGSRVLEDDLVTISGESVGTISYKSTMAGKITVPAIAANIINDQGKASDDYGY